MSHEANLKLPARVTVSSVVSSRYGEGSVKGGRPASWDARTEGVDVVKTAEGRTLKLFSDGQQSTPHPGWVLMVTDGNESDGYRWTLYGIPKS